MHWCSGPIARDTAFRCLRDARSVSKKIRCFRSQMARRRLPLAGSDVSNYDIIRDCEGALALIAGGSSAGALLFESRMNRVQLVITVDSGAIGAAPGPVSREMAIADAGVTLVRSLLKSADKRSYSVL